MTVPADAPPPALGELARLATEAQKAIDEYTALYHRAPPLGGALYSEFCRDLSAACSPAVILQLVALASGGAAGGLQQEQDLDKTAKNQQLEPVLPNESPARRINHHTEG